MSKLVKYLNQLFINRGISEVNHYQSFFIEMITDDRKEGWPINVRIQLYSDWRINDAIWWDNFLKKTPRLTSSLAMPDDCMRAFSLFYLKDFDVISIDILDNSDLVVKFSNSDFLYVPGRSEAIECSWIIDVPVEPEFCDFNIICDECGEIYISDYAKKIIRL